MREIWSSSVLSRNLTTYPAHAIPPHYFWFLEGRNKSALRYLHLESCMSQTPSSDIIRNIVLCLLLFMLSSQPLSLCPSTFSAFPFQIFEGNSNYDTPELRMVEPLLTRFIRIYPERATPAGMGLRLELLGCEIEGIKSFAMSVFYLNDHLSFGEKHTKGSSNGISTYGGDISTCGADFSTSSVYTSGGKPRVKPLSPFFPVVVML